MLPAINDPHPLIHLWLFCDGDILIIAFLPEIKITYLFG